MKRYDKWNYVIETLEQYGVKPVGNRPTFNNSGDIVIHSKQLKNVIIITPQATQNTIKKQVEMQLKIAGIM